MPRTEALASWLTRSRVEKPKVSQLADYETPSKAVFISDGSSTVCFPSRKRFIDSRIRGVNIIDNFELRNLSIIRIDLED